MSLPAALRAHAARIPRATAFTFLEHGERESGGLDFGRLDLRARAIGAHLQAKGAAGAPVAIAAPGGLAFVEAFFGCLYAGAIAVPLPEDGTRRGRDRAQAILGDASPAFTLDETSLKEIPDQQAARWRDPLTGDKDVALLQYTSGSTDTPRGAIITHGSLAANLRAIAEAFRLDSGTRGVNWLPLYHDMGLVGGIAAPVFLGIASVLLPPLAFLQNPLRWLAALARYGGTTSGAPSFAYDACARALERRPPRELDLSKWTLAFCGAEPVRAEALERFARAAAPYGFRREALLPCYGLAEATLLVTAAAPGAGVRAIDGRVDCGAACRDTEVALGEGGEILVRGPGLCAGYWKKPEESSLLFQDGWLRTGDLGLLRDGHLVVTGRLKDLIVIRGQNHHPEDLERTARRAHAALDALGGAAFSIDTGAAEELVLVHEAARAEDAAAAARAIAARIAEEHGLAPREIVLIRPGTLPRTANGKVRRARCREAYLAGTLAVLARVSPSATP